MTPRLCELATNPRPSMSETHHSQGNRLRRYQEVQVLRGRPAWRLGAIRPLPRVSAAKVVSVWHIPVSVLNEPSSLGRLSEVQLSAVQKRT